VQRRHPRSRRGLELHAVARRPVSLRFLLLGSALPMVLGGVVYLLFRNTHMLMFQWVDLAGLTDPLMRARSWAAPLRQWMPGWLLFSLPDGAWVFSCTAFFAHLWPDGPWWMRWGWIGLGTVLAMGGELGQLVGLVPGVFDPRDLVAYLLAAGLALLITHAWGRRVATA